MMDPSEGHLRRCDTEVGSHLPDPLDKRQIGFDRRRREPRLRSTDVLCG